MNRYQLSKFVNIIQIECTRQLLPVSHTVARSRIQIFYPSRIPDPKTPTKERGEKKFGVIPFFVTTNFTKLRIILFLKC
jgi:hypothetical protein